MRKFALSLINEIKGRIKLFKLIVDNKCLYDEFEKEIEKEGNYKSELRTIETRLQEIADCKSMPGTKFRDITPEKDSTKEYEIKTHHLRVYLFQDKRTGHIIVLAGKKGTQKADIKQLRKLKNEYFKNR